MGLISSGAWTRSSSRWARLGRACFLRDIPPTRLAQFCSPRCSRNSDAPRTQYYRSPARRFQSSRIVSVAVRESSSSSSSSTSSTLFSSSVFLGSQREANGRVVKPDVSEHGTTAVVDDAAASRMLTACLSLPRVVFPSISRRAGRSPNHDDRSR